VEALVSKESMNTTTRENYIQQLDALIVEVDKKLGHFRNLISRTPARPDSGLV
jgi:5'(3')-deoxyribonucleotidase